MEQAGRHDMVWLAVTL
jgi:hypothetical protein